MEEVFLVHARGVRRATGRAMTTVMAVALMLAGLIGVVAQEAAPASAAPGGVVYNSIPTVALGNVPSLGFEANQTAEFGDQVTLASAGALQSAKVLMSSWGCQTGSGATCATTPGATFNHPITFNAYAPANNTTGVGALLYSKTQTFAIPYRPSADPVNCPSSPTAWYSAADNACYNGFATPITFDLSSTPQPVQSTIIWTVAYNTSNYGATPLDPMNLSGPHPYDSLNVGLNNVSGPSVGTDVNSDNVFWNTSTAGNYTDGGTAGVGVLRFDTNWTPYVPAVQLTQLTLPTVSVGNTFDVEGNSGTTTANVPVTLNHPYPAPVTVHYATAVGGGTTAATKATAGSDYTTKSGTLTIPANTTSATIPISVIGDTKLEQNEAFLVNLSAPTNATLTMAQSSVVTIRNDELPQVVVKGPGSAVAEGTAAAFVITLKQPYYTALNLTAATVGNTAASPGDYTTVNQTVTFPSQDVSAKTVNVSVKKDGLTEPVEAFYLQLTGGSATVMDQAKIKANNT